MSKTSLALAGTVILGAAILAGASPPQGEDPAVLLRAAIETEEVDGDLNAAIEQYKQVVKTAGGNRAIAAQALLRLGGCYEKRGPDEARRTYQQLIRDYREQAREVAAARRRIAALTAGAPAARTADSRLAIRRLPDYKTVGSLDMLAKPSPDGKYFAATDWKSGNLVLVDVTTGETRPLTTDGAMGDVSRYAMICAWSRDSRRIACDWSLQGPDEDRMEARIVTVDGSVPPQTISIPGARWIEPLDWSADGSRVLCSHWASSGDSSLVLVAAGSGAIEKLDVPSTGSRYHFSPDGRHLLYSAPADGKAAPNDIYLRNLDTGKTTAVVQHPAEDLVVGLLPGTDWLLFASDRRAPLDLWAVRLRGATVEGQPLLVKQGLGRFYPLGFTDDGRLYYATLSASDDLYTAEFDPVAGRIVGEAGKFTSRWDGVSSFPSISPDGSSLAYVVKRGPRPMPIHAADSLVVQSLKDAKAEPLIVGFEDVDYVSRPCWLADGSAIVVAGYESQGQKNALFRVEMPGLRKTRVFSPPAGWRAVGHECAIGQPNVYVLLEPLSAEARDGFRIVRVDGNGASPGELFRAHEGQRNGGRIGMSPDGRKLSLITRLDRYRRALLVMPSEGGTPRQVHEFRQPSGGGVEQVWAPDGLFILYVQGPEDKIYTLWKIPADGGAGPEKLFERRGQVYSFSFHPNGRQLVFTSRPDYSTTSEVWVIENLRGEMKLLAPEGRLP